MTARAIGWTGALLAAAVVWVAVGGAFLWGAAAVAVIPGLFGGGMVAGWLLGAAAMITHAKECPSCRADLERVGNCPGRAG